MRDPRDCFARRIGLQRKLPTSEIRSGCRR
jgi:hypothetical protein